MLLGYQSYPLELTMSRCSISSSCQHLHLCPGVSTEWINTTLAAVNQLLSLAPHPLSGITQKLLFFSVPEFSPRTKPHSCTVVAGLMSDPVFLPFLAVFLTCLVSHASQIYILILFWVFLTLRWPICPRWSRIYYEFIFSVPSCDHV